MLLVRGKGEKDWKEAPGRSYQSERALQDLLLNSPELIPGVDRVRAVIADEVALGGGAADLVAVDADGTITIVECKLEGNPELRRTVVGQILAYAAALWKLDFEGFEAVMKRRGVDLFELGQEADATDGAEGGPDHVRQLVSRSLSEGAFRLVIAVDHITSELRSIIEWLNAHTSAKVAVLGLEIAHLERGNVELVLSDVYGEESAATKRATSAEGSRRWTEQDLEAAFAKIDPPLANALRRLYEHMKSHPTRDHWYWGDGKVPSVTPWIVDDVGATQPWSMYVGGGAGLRPVYVNFDWIHRRGDGYDAAAMERFARRLEALPGLNGFADDARKNGWRRRPGIREEVLRQPGVVDGLIAALDELYGKPVGPLPDATLPLQ